MAIFESKQDADLPLVSQLMQIDTYDQTEIKKFWDRVTWLSYNSDILFGEPSATAATLEKQKGEDFQHRLEDFKLACYHGQLIFQALHEKQAVPMDSLIIIRNKFQTGEQMQLDESRLDKDTWKYRETFVYKDAQGTSLSRVETYAPFAAFIPMHKLGNWLPGYYLASEIEDALTALWHKKARLCVCMECRNIFYATRAEAVFCSHRCGNKNRTRKRRAGELKTTQNSVSPILTNYAPH